jgi:hypothetical protein
MFGTNKLCIKGIYLPTFQLSIILRANEVTKNLHSLTTFGGKIPQKLVSLLVSLYI